MIKKCKIDKDSLGYSVYRRRKALNMTVKQLAEKSNLETAWLIQLERDEIEERIDAKVLLQIAVALETTIADLYGLPITRINEKGEFYRE